MPVRTVRISNLSNEIIPDGTGARVRVLWNQDVQARGCRDTPRPEALTFGLLPDELLLSAWDRRLRADVLRCFACICGVQVDNAHDASLNNSMLH